MPEEKSIDDDDVIVDSLKIDFTDPAFMIRSIKYDRNFEDFNIINEECRSRMIRTSCDQTCFYVLCALKAYELIGEIPSILVYGGNGVMGSCIIDALVECGCKPLLKIFARDSKTVQKWLKVGIRSTVQLDEFSKVDILIIASNLASFSQMCRDLGLCFRSTTFVISTVFGMQRKRVYNLFEAPGVVRTFVERKMSKRKKFSSAKLLLYRKDSMKNLFLIVENFMVLLGIEPSVAREELFNIFLGLHHPPSPASKLRSISFDSIGGISLSRQPSFEEEESEQEEGDGNGNNTPTLSLPSMSPAMSPAHSSSDIFTPIKPQSRRTSAVDDNLSLPPPFSPQGPALSSRSLQLNPPSSPLLPSIHGSRHNSRPSTRENATSHFNLEDLAEVIDALHTAYGVLFAEELSKHVDEMKLPSMHAIRSSKVLSPMPKKVQPKKFRRFSHKDQTRVVDTKKYRGYLDEDAILRIFNCDKKTAPDMKTSEYLEYINSLSEDEDEKGDEDELDFDLETFSGEDFFNTPEPVEAKYVVKSGMVKTPSGSPMISRLESDIFVGKSEGKRFNIPSSIESFES